MGSHGVGQGQVVRPARGNGLKLLPERGHMTWELGQAMTREEKELGLRLQLGQGQGRETHVKVRSC